ncbi:MAG: hypothetical protein WHV66_08680 [Anaerolineales bacterium]
MKTKILCCLLIVLLLIACTSPTTRSSIEIPKLADYYETLMVEAQKWSADAYLYSVDFAVGEKKPWVLSAGFYSPTHDRESLEVILDLQMKISQRRFSHQYEILLDEPILPAQWEIDSQDALKILLSENQNTIDSIDVLCGSLKLSRVSILPNRPLVWWLTYYECGTTDAHYAYMDPLTGEIITP